MKLGSMMYASRGAMDIVEFARISEQSGFESIWLAEHSHRPISEAERGGWDNWTLPPLIVDDVTRPLIVDNMRGHATLADPWVIFGAWAAVTSEVKLGTAITLVMQRDPIHLAKEVATADVLSGGRVLFGVGFGHSFEPYLQEMINHGTDPRQRFGVARERVLAMKEIWTQEEAEFHGRHVNFGPIWSEPKPVQQPYPPILLGSSGGPSRETWERRLNWLLEYCDGWLPLNWEPELAERIDELQSRAHELGKPRYEITVLWPNEGRMDQVDEQFGALEERHLDEYAEKGVDRMIFFPPYGPADEIVPQLKRYGDLATKYA